jgi:NADH:ubiquinone oxidoreductase subunit
VGIATGTTSAIAAAILKTLKLFIVGSICGTQPNPFAGRTFPSVTPFVRMMSLSGSNCTRNERIASFPRQSAAAGRRLPSPLRATGLDWTIRPADGIQTSQHSRTGARMKLFLLKLFTWWNGQTFGTQLWTWRFGELVGVDEQGNRYFRTKGREIDPSLGFERRWVVYNGYAEATRVPPSWHGWLHHTVDVAPTEESYTPREWEKPHIPNMTGTPAAYRPSGSTLASGRRPKATGDYQPWTPGN